MKRVFYRRLGEALSQARSFRKARTLQIVKLRAPLTICRFRACRTLRETLFIRGCSRNLQPMPELIRKRSGFFLPLPDRGRGMPPAGRIFLRASSMSIPHAKSMRPLWYKFFTAPGLVRLSSLWDSPKPLLFEKGGQLFMQSRLAARHAYAVKYPFSLVRYPRISKMGDSGGLLLSGNSRAALWQKGQRMLHASKKTVGEDLFCRNPP